jgi:hypothetical protein
MDDDITLRPGFDVITMISEWRDHLEGGGYSFEGKQAAGLISTLITRHMALFRMDLVQMGLSWDEIEGQVTVNPWMVDAIERGFIDRPCKDVVDLAWLDCFDTVCEDLDDIVSFLYQTGEL